jgi:hypothetical protein
MADSYYEFFHNDFIDTSLANVWEIDKGTPKLSTVIGMPVMFSSTLTTLSRSGQLVILINFTDPFECLGKCSCVYL